MRFSHRNCRMRQIKINTDPAKPGAKPEPSTLDKILNSGAAKQVERTAASMITRGLLGALGWVDAAAALKSRVGFNS